VSRSGINLDKGSSEFYRDRVTRSVEPVTQPEARLERVLDAAADLLVRLGYRRVTIEEVARQARIGKGTVYLHFPTKEALFLAVLLRTHHGVTARMVARMEADPAEVLPGRLMRSLYLDIAEDPVTRPLYLGDGEVLGRLAHEAVETLGELTRRRQEAGRAWFGLLREAGLLRPGDVDAQLYTLSAISTGFYFLDTLPVPGVPTERAVRAELLEQAVSAALEVPAALGGAAGIAPAVAELYRSLIDHIDEEWRGRLR
jgi:AcrR family transcriptional regulator